MQLCDLADASMGVDLFNIGYTILRFMAVAQSPKKKLGAPSGPNYSSH